MKRISILVSGKVQGVFYRANTEKIANKIGLAGFVKNLPDGNVYIEAQGKQEQLDQLCEWCKRGPERAVVTGLLTTEIPLQEEISFRIVKSS
jgi:acylphosphatase